MTVKCQTCGAVLTPQQAGEPCPNCRSKVRNTSVQDQGVFEEKARVAKELANKHYQVEPGLTRVIRFSGPADVEAVPAEPIKLLEVNLNTVPSGVLPLRFGPSIANGITFPSIIVEVTPEEFEQIKAKKLSLPPGWDIEDELPRVESAAGVA